MKGKGSPAILFIDIETSPLLSAHWGLFDQNIGIDSIIQDWYIISISWMWSEENIVRSFTVKPTDHLNDYQVVKRMHELLGAADIVVAHNGDAFDIKKFNARAIFHDFPPLPPLQTVDTLKTARRVFKFTSNKMDYIGRHLKLGQKVDTPRGLWMKACFGALKERREAIKMMAEYNEGDVVLLERVYRKLLPYMKSHPNLNLYQPEDGCPNCGGKVVQNGTRPSRSGLRQQYICKSCGAYATGKAIKGTHVEIK